MTNEIAACYQGRGSMLPLGSLPSVPVSRLSRFPVVQPQRVRLLRPLWVLSAESAHANG